LEALEDLVYFLSEGDIAKMKYILKNVTLNESLEWVDVIERNRKKAELNG
jgi:hypothetical protein|tara:strand:+ start:536 stop:685 length:150 start_codon:yes stop_codon:yes gene_type:complete